MAPAENRAARPGGATPRPSQTCRTPAYCFVAGFALSVFFNVSVFTVTSVFTIAVSFTRVVVVVVSVVLECSVWLPPQAVAAIARVKTNADPRTSERRRTDVIANAP